MQDDLIGKTLGQFEIIEEIGRGGMASVYRARQTSINRIVAIKVLPRSLLHDPSFYERFIREVELVTHLEHPHILPIHDYGEVDGTPYIAMRYLAGGSMAQWIKRGLPPLDKLAKPIEQVSSALDYAHQEGVIHRDVKPGNILLDEHGNAYLSDFGIARVLDSSLTGSALVGTPAYMSPEQANGLPLDARSDIYSLGVVLYELATGRSPFDAETPVALLLKHINEPLPAPRILRPELPVSAERVIFKATAKRPEDRYPSASDLAEAFAAALGAHGRAPLDDEKTAAELSFDPDTLVKRIPIPSPNQATPQSLTTATDVRNAGTPTATDLQNAAEPAPRANVSVAAPMQAEPAAKPPRRSSTIVTVLVVMSILAVLIGLGTRMLNNNASGIETRIPTITQPPTISLSQVAALASELPNTAAPINTTVPLIAITELAATENSTLPTVSPAQTELSVTDAASSGGVQGQIAFETDRDGNKEIYVMNLDGTGLRNLTNNPAGDEYPKWSPDGTKIAFMSYRDDPTTAYTYIMDADGSNPHRLLDEALNSAYPAWSPDGKQLALTFYTGEGYPQIEIVDADGKNLHPVSNLPTNVGLATWSPDGKTIAFMSDDGTNHEVYKINIDGTGLVNLTQNADEDGYPAWSLTNNLILFQHNRLNDNPSLYIMDSSGGSLRPISNKLPDSHNAAWSPDGTQIAFASYDANGEEIYVMNADGTNVRPITDSHSNNGYPAWRP